MFENVIRLANVQEGSIVFNSDVELSISRKELEATLSNFNGRVESNQIIFTDKANMLAFASKYFGYLAKSL